MSDPAAVHIQRKKIKVRQGTPFAFGGTASDPSKRIKGVEAYTLDGVPLPAKASSIRKKKAKNLDCYQWLLILPPLDKTTKVFFDGLYYHEGSPVNLPGCKDSDELEIEVVPRTYRDDDRKKTVEYLENLLRDDSKRDLHDTLREALAGLKRTPSFFYPFEDPYELTPEEHDYFLAYGDWTSEPKSILQATIGSTQASYIYVDDYMWVAQFPPLESGIGYQTLLVVDTDGNPVSRTLNL